MHLPRGSAAVWLILTAAATGQDRAAPPESVLSPVGKGWVPLFNGKGTGRKTW